MCYRISLFAVWLAALALTGCERSSEPNAAVAPSSPAARPLVALPSPPLLSPEGYQLLLDYEVGGGERYYTLKLARPTWPGYESGVTIGVGYDLGYNSAGVIRTDWHEVNRPWLGRLAAVSGIKGRPAKPEAAELRDILIAWRLAEGVFQRVTLTRFHQLAARTFPGFTDLHPNAQAALVSLVFNRGSSMTGPRRAEMRSIRDRVPRQDYAGIAADIRAMIPIWAGTSIEKGMRRRREAEARLVELAIH